MPVMQQEKPVEQQNRPQRQANKKAAQGVQNKPAGEKSILEKMQDFRVEFGPSKREILNFTNQLAVMVRAGISLQEALEMIASQTEKLKFRAILHDIKERIEGGASFSQALAEHRNVFSNLYINMVAAAEVSGSLSQMLDQLAEYLDHELDTRSQVVSAMVYPIIIAVMAISVTTFLLIFVLPRFLKIFQGKEHLLPGPTKIIMATSGTLRGYWYIIVPCVIAVFAGFLFFIKTKVGKLWWDSTKLKLPLMAKLCRALYISRGLHTMSVLTNAGVPILDTIMITAQISGNVLHERMWRGVHESVRQGKKIASSLGEYNLMPGQVVQMIRSGEDSGTLSKVLADVADFYTRELKTVIKMVTSMIEPIMIVVMGFIVGFIAMSIILPIFKMSAVVTSH